MNRIVTQLPILKHKFMKCVSIHIAITLSVIRALVPLRLLTTCWGNTTNKGHMLASQYSNQENKI